MTIDSRFFVVAPSYQWFLSWCQDREINPRDRHVAVYIQELKDVQGYEVIDRNHIVDLGPFDSKRYELVLALSRRIKR